MAYITYTIPSKIKKTGGALRDYYHNLTLAIDDLDCRVFDFLKALGLADDIEIYLPLALSEKDITIFTAYKSHYYKTLIKEGVLQEGEPVPTKYKRKAGYNYREAYKKYGINFYSYHRNYKIIKAFAGALKLDKEKGLFIKEKAFIDLYTTLTEEVRGHIHEKHLKACEALNSFFCGLPITQEEILRYFSFSKGIAEPREDTIANGGYLRLR